MVMYDKCIKNIFHVDIFNRIFLRSYYKNLETFGFFMDRIGTNFG